MWSRSQQFSYPANALIKSSKQVREHVRPLTTTSELVRPAFSMCNSTRRNNAGGNVFGMVCARERDAKKPPLVVHSELCDVTVCVLVVLECVSVYG